MKKVGCVSVFVGVVGFVGVLFAGELEPQWISDQDGSKWTGDVKSQPALPKNTIRMRRTFELPNLPVRQAVAEMCGYGFAEFWVNGESADPRRRLSPAVCDYRKRALSATYDVTALMRPGCNNTIGLWVSPGYSDDFSQHGWRWLRPKRAWGRLDITFADGSRQTVVTDDGWEWTDRTPIEAVSVYGGERYDASRRSRLVSARRVDRRMEARCLCEADLLRQTGDCAGEESRAVRSHDGDLPPDFGLRDRSRGLDR